MDNALTCALDFLVNLKGWQALMILTVVGCVVAIVDYCGNDDDNDNA